MNEVTLHIAQEVALPENRDWKNRFEITGESGNIYVVSQNKKRGHWGCSCAGYRIHRSCKHLSALGLPPKERPYEPKIEGCVS